jgi:aminopeptidase N
MLKVARQRGILALSSLILAAIPTLHAQRLPTNAHPTSYSLHLTPNLTTATFSGDETISLTLDQPSTTITLNAAEIKFLSVKAYVLLEGMIAGPAQLKGIPPQDADLIKLDTNSHTATITLDDAKEQATFTFPTPLPADRQITLAISYTGILNNQLRGFYLSKTKSRNYAVTQFEPTDARRAFPSFDEPAYKATFDIALTVDTADTVISNTNQISDKPATPGKHTLRFATTPRMSTYLVAFLVGDFECTKGKSDGVPIRACATPGKANLTKFAVESAEYILHYYDNYFGIKYPMPKLDMVALPDFEAGAMENFGCITYRETDLLLNDKFATIPQRKNVATVVAHEMAHQWFGDMVTMQWWDDIWLNEGFATWMESKSVNTWHPEWNLTQDEAQDLDDTLNDDSGKTTRPIRAKAETPDEINEAFDDIAYGKAGAVLAMVENYLGPELFRQGVHNYLNAHLYANATAEDLWEALNHSAQTTTGHDRVDDIFQTFINNPGVPLLDLSDKDTNGYPILQTRFFLSSPWNPCSDTHSENVCITAKSGHESLPSSWIIPVCVKTSGSPTCRVVTPTDSTLTISADLTVPLFYANATARGYYRTRYTPQQYTAIAAAAETTLTPTERIGLLGDRWALVNSGDVKVGELLDLILSLKQDPNAAVLDTALGKVRTIQSRISSDEDRDALNAVLRRQFEPIYTALGPPQKHESFDRQQLRAILFETLGEAGDTTVLAQANQMSTRIFEMHAKPDKTLDPTLSDIAVAVAARAGDSEFYEKSLALSRYARDPGLQSDGLHLLAHFHSSALVNRTLDYAVSGEVRNLLQQRETQQQAWNYIRDHWSQVQAQFTTNSGNRVVAATGAFCTQKLRDEVATFFKDHPVEASERTLNKALDNIDACINLRATQEPNLHQWLTTQSQ